MHRLFQLILFIFVLIPCQAFSQSSTNELVDKNFSFAFSPFYLQEHFQWSIAGNIHGTHPNIFSELIWKNLSGSGIKAELDWKFWKELFCFVEFSESFIWSGSVTDTDYEEDNRNQVVFYEELKSNKGLKMRVFPGLEYAIDLNEIIRLMLRLGYSINKQNYFLLNDQTNYHPEILESSYNTKWCGPGFGINSVMNLNRYFSCNLGYHYHQVKYSAEANWNLIDTFQHPVSFAHSAYGYGSEGNCQLNYAFKETGKIYLYSNFYKWSTGKGIDELYKTDGQILKTQLNDVTLKGFNLGLGFQVQL